MKKYLPVALLILALNFSARAQYVTIPDTAFVSWLKGNGYAAALNVNQLDTTNTLVTTATTMACTAVPIRDLTGIQYFKALHTLNCSNDSVSIIPSFPAAITSINCSYNLLDSLPTLPTGLLTLRSTHNPISALPVLPHVLATAAFDTCAHLTALPVLPSTLKVLTCSYCSLVALPSLPVGLTKLVCSYCQLSALPALSDSLVVLDFRSNANITCLPELTRIDTLNFTGTGVTCLPNYGDVTNSTPALNTLQLCGIYGATGCPAFWTISGTVYYDNNNDCILDYTDVPQPNVKVKLDSANVLVQQVYTNAAGLFSFQATKNHTYMVTVDTSLNSFRSGCPANDYHLDTLTLVDSLSYNNNFAVQCRGFDVGTESVLSVGLPRPGAHIQLNTVAGDLTSLYGSHCAAGQSGQVQLTYSGPVTYTGPAVGALAVSSINGKTIIWDIADYGAVNPLTAFNLLFAIDSNAPIGASICINVNVTPFLNDANQLNNNFNYCFAVVNSLKGNEKDAYPIDTIGLNNQWLTYTIRFQNTGNAPAVNMVIVDTLSANVDPSTFLLLAHSAENLTQLFGNRVVFNFPNINLPDSAANPLASTGYVQYAVKLKTGITAGAIITNRASVYFNLSNPVLTNTIADTVVRCKVNGSATTNTICYGDIFDFGGNFLDSTGTYIDTLINHGGCDSVVTLYLVVNPVTYDSINKTLCTGDTFYLDSTHVYYRFGTYYDTVTNVLGCDSFITIVVIVDQVSYDTIYEQVCTGDSVHIGSSVYGAAGIYNDTIFTTGGCPVSVTTLYLSLYPLPVVTFGFDSTIYGFERSSFILACSNVPAFDSLVLSGGSPVGGSYAGPSVRHNVFFQGLSSGGVDSIVYTYTDSNGCKASVADTIFETPCSGISTIGAADFFSLYPNPADDYVMTDYNAAYTGATILVKDITGRQLYQTRLTTSPQQIPTGNLPPGVYLVTLNNGAQIGARLLVKE